MAGLRHSNDFLQSFEQGFSFVDNINRQKRDEARLDERLKQEQAQREYNRDMARRADARAQAQADRQAETFRTNKDALEREKTARTLVASNASDDELRKYADTPAGYAELARRRGENEAVAAAKELNGLVASQQPTTPPPGGLADQAAGLTAPESQLAPSRGTDSLQSVQQGQIDQFDQQSSDLPPSVGQAVRTISPYGGAPGLAGAIKNLLTGGASQAQNVTVPEDYTTPQEFAKMSDPKQIEQARQRNFEVTQALRNKAEDPKANVAAQRVKGGDKYTAEAQQAEQAMVARYSSFLDPKQESSLRALTQDSPDVAATTYFRDRATLNAASPDLRAAMDKQMIPVIRDYEQQLVQQIKSTEPNSPGRTRQVQRLYNVQATVAQMYADYSPNKEAGIDARGVPAGNADLVGRVTDSMDSPDRVRPAAPQPTSQLNASMTTVGRIGSGTKRLNDRQIRAIVRLKDAGMLSSADVQSLLMTGTLPGTAAKIVQVDPTKDVWVQQGNTIKLARAGSAKGKVQLNELDKPAIDNMTIGFDSVFPGADEKYKSAMVKGVLSDLDGWKKSFDFSNQESMIKLGEVLGNYMTLVSKETDRLDDWINWRPSTWFDEPPTLKKLLDDPDFAATLAGRYDIVLNNMPEQRPQGNIPQGFDVDQARSLMASGRYGGDAQQVAQQGSNEEVFAKASEIAAREQALHANTGQ